MPGSPKDMSKRPDLIAEVLEVSRFSTLYFGRFEAGGPWAFAVPEKPSSSFYIVLEGTARVSLASGEVVLRARDLVLLPHCSAHRLDDGSTRGKRMAARPSSTLMEDGVRGGDGARTAFVSGCFRFSAGATHPLVRSLPEIVLFRAADASPLLRSLVDLIALESSAPTSGSSVILARVTDCLLVHALRSRTAEEGDGLRALGDPGVATALERMHAAPGDAWTVEKLAAAAGLSRSGFAARFQELVGEPPLRYLTQWRVMKAAAWLTETKDSVDEIAGRLGYESGPAFQKAFKRVKGVGPGAFRRASREPAVLSSS